MRLRLAVVGAAFVVSSACVPPPPKDLSNNFVVSYAGPAPSDFMTVRAVQGTVTNTGVTPADYSVEVVASSGQTASYDALDVLAGQTAIWFIGVEGDVTVAQTTVTSSATTASPVPAVATITRLRNGGLVTVVDGTVTNTGGSAASFDIELQANSGGVAIASAHDVQPGQTVGWSGLFISPTATARIVRITTFHPPPPPPP